MTETFYAAQQVRVLTGQGAGCLSRESGTPDLREPWVGNCPLLPSRFPSGIGRSASPMGFVSMGTAGSSRNTSSPQRRSIA